MPGGALGGLSRTKLLLPASDRAETRVCSSSSMNCENVTSSSPTPS